MGGVCFIALLGGVLFGFQVLVLSVLSVVLDGFTRRCKKILMLHFVNLIRAGYGRGMFYSSFRRGIVLV